MNWLLMMTLGSVVGGIVGLSNVIGHLPAEQHHIVADAFWHVIHFATILAIGNSIIAIAQHYGLTALLARVLSRAVSR